MTAKHRPADPGGTDSRTGKIRTDERGRSIWVDPVESGEFDLISTGELRLILDSEDDHSLRSIEEVARGGEEGVLARDVSTGLFRVIDENELQGLLANDRGRPKPLPPADAVAPPPAGGSTDEFSLVSTQTLRRMIDGNLRPAADADEAAMDLPDTDPDADTDTGGGFDPYNSG